MVDDIREDGKPKEKITYTCPSLSLVAFYTAIVCVLLAILIPIEFRYGKLAMFKKLDLSVPDGASLKDYILHKLGVVESRVTAKHFGTKDRLFTKDELKTYSGDSQIIYLAILGQVFDVTKGASKYGKGGGYSFFAGIDGTRAYISGKFDDEGLVDDIDGLRPSDFLGLEDWLSFYKKDYIYVGKLIGYFYDKDGNENEGINIFKEGVKMGNIEKLNSAEDSKLYPGCNSRWTPETGANVWCELKSGGVDRDWVGFPRKYFMAGQTNHRCACIKEELFNDPRFKEYEDCDSKAYACKVKDD